MTRLEQGILINSQHLHNVLNNISEDVSFRDQILALGYKDIEEFFNEKAIHEMQETLRDDLYSTPMDELAYMVNTVLKNHDHGIISIYTDETCVCHGDNQAKTLNEEYCLEHNIPIYPYNSFGGNIVATPEDYGVLFVLPQSIDVSAKLILENITEILAKYFEDVEIQGNDILIDGKKVAGSGSFGNDEIFVMMLYFSMSDKGDLVYNICGEPVTGKTAGYIDPAILPGEQLKSEVLSWLQGL